MSGSSEATKIEANNGSVATGGSEDPGNITDLTLMIQGVLQQTQDRFQHLSDSIIRRIDDMTKRIDDLEKSITDLMTQNQMEQPQI
ncbi:unnamed protein product, partial [Mesorhabditis belari]|uniref:Heat shock factor binding protein 1 n=1 Tax=Mesorhabditis belari TaxID=2138241 RepID=A0AAF3F3L4_9BILA